MSGDTLTRETATLLIFFFLSLYQKGSAMRRKYGLVRFLVDVLLIICTGGLWLLWIILRYLRTH